MRPYDHVPFQWSVHRQEWAGELIKRYDFLAKNTSDPRVQFLETLCDAVKGADSIVVYNQRFEASRLDDLARWLPRHRQEIAEIKAKLWDLLAVVRCSVYHPAFGGSFSLKRVAAAILPDMSYDDLGVADGIQAGIAWAQLVDPATSPEEKDKLKRALLQYCGQDTIALARIIEELVKQSRATG